MIHKRAGETWKVLRFAGSRQLRYKYALSSLGRMASFRLQLFSDGKILKGSFTTGYKTLNLHRDGRQHTLYLHRETAKAFLPKPSPQHRFVIHINHDRHDNRVQNLQWATAAQMQAHQQQSPARLAYKTKQAERPAGLKLSQAQVKKIKLWLASEQRQITIRQLAQKFGVSEMTLYRIKKGESWSHL